MSERKDLGETLPNSEVIGDAADRGNKSRADSTDNEANPVQLTPEEQMALFEKELKENDWGHQPC